MFLHLIDYTPCKNHSAAWVGGGLLCVIRFYHTRGSGSLRRLVGIVLLDGGFEVIHTDRGSDVQV